MVNFNVTLFFDTVCPWCFIGHRALQNAVSKHRLAYPSDTFNLTFSPFILDRYGQLRTEAFPEHITTMFGSPAHFPPIQAALRQAGEPLDINFGFNWIVGSTLDSHRLIYAAGTITSQPKLQEAVIDEVLQPFVKGGSVADRNFLAEAGVRAGMEEAKVQQVLGSSAFRVEVLDLAAKARESGVVSVPTIEINGVKFRGATDAKNLEQTLAAIRDGKKEVGS